MYKMEVQRWKSEDEMMDEEKVDEVIAIEEREFKEEDSMVSLLRKRCNTIKTNKTQNVLICVYCYCNTSYSNNS